MNQQDMESAGLKKLDVVDITSTYDGIERTANKFKVIPFAIPKGDLAAYFPETNVLVPYNHFSDRSKTPISKSIKVTLKKV